MQHEANRIVSIHLMLRFKLWMTLRPARCPPCFNTSNVKVQVSRFNTSGLPRACFNTSNVKVQGGQRSELASHVKVSIHLMLRFKLGFFGKYNIFNWVSIHLMLRFKQVPSYLSYLMSQSFNTSNVKVQEQSCACLPVHMQVSIHLMLRFKFRIFQFLLETEHVSIHLMLRFKIASRSHMLRR